MVSGLQVCPSELHEDVARSYGLVYRPVLGRRAGQRRINKIPIDRLLVSDIRRRPGALTALIVLAVMLVILINQIRVIRKTGWPPHYAGWYVAGGLVLLVLALLPGLTLRRHHYIVALVLLPVTAFPTRLSAIYQAFLLGLFISGGAAFQWDSILQTAAEVCTWTKNPHRSVS